MANMVENYIQCDGECGAEIRLSSRDKKSVSVSVLMSVAELLDWTTRDHGKETEVYCPFCQNRARRIVEGS